jgi:hypothetical protein
LHVTPVLRADGSPCRQDIIAPGARQGAGYHPEDVIEPDVRPRGGQPLGIGITAQVAECRLSPDPRFLSPSTAVSQNVPLPSPKSGPGDAEYERSPSDAIICGRIHIAKSDPKSSEFVHRDKTASAPMPRPPPPSRAAPPCHQRRDRPAINIPANGQRVSSSRLDGLHLRPVRGPTCSLLAWRDCWFPSSNVHAGGSSLPPRPSLPCSLP